MSLDVLLQAAEYIERKEREMEHGYASFLPSPDDHSKHSSTRHGKRSTRSKSRYQSNRSTHNELEKNRRAHLRHCLEKLKEMVPLSPDGSRHTTLGLLTRAKHFIKTLEDREKKSCAQKAHLFNEQRFLRRRLETLGSQVDLLRQMSKRRSTSESSNASSTMSEETEEVDVLGYTSSHSDSDDHSSVQSNLSDCGLTFVSSRRLPLNNDAQGSFL